MTKVIGQAWKEMIEEYGSEAPVNAKCSFGKGLFEDKIRNLRPAGLKFKDGSNVEFRLGFGCSIEI